MYSVPFYGESSFLMYRKDMFEQAGITVMSDRPADLAGGRRLRGQARQPSGRMAGICLRGKPGWGEVLAPLDTVINTFGGRWFDDQWNAQLNSPEVEKAVNFYVDMVKRPGEPGPSKRVSRSAPTASARARRRCGTTRRRRYRCSRIRRRTNVVGKIGYAARADRREAQLGLALHLVAGHPQGSQESRRRMEVHLVDDQQGLHEAGRREAGLGAGATGQPHLHLHRSPEYEAISEVLRPADAAVDHQRDPDKPTVQPVPYTGIQFVGIPEFQDLGTRVSQQISAAIAGQKSVDAALEQAQQYAEVVGKTYQEK